jgi:hypothetical protein
MLPVMRDRSTEKTMITETFYNGFETVMRHIGRKDKPMTDEDCTYMCGLLKGGQIVHHLNQHDLDKLIPKFEAIDQKTSDYRVYVDIVREMMNEQLIDADTEQETRNEMRARAQPDIIIAEEKEE